MVYKMRYRSQHPYSIKEKQMKSEVLSVKEKMALLQIVGGDKLIIPFC